MKLVISNPPWLAEAGTAVHGTGWMRGPPSLTPTNGLLSLWQSCAIAAVLDINLVNVSSGVADNKPTMRRDAACCPAKFVADGHGQCSSHAPCSSKGYFEPHRCNVYHPWLTSLLKPGEVLSQANLAWALLHVQ